MAEMNPWAEARAQIQAQRMVIQAEGEMLGENPDTYPADPDTYPADVQDLAGLVDRVAAWQLNRDMVVGRTALVGTEQADVSNTNDTYDEADVASSLGDYRLARSDLRQAVRQLAQRWATEDEEDNE